MNQPLKGRVGFAVGTGRCGTTFLAEVVKREPHVAATHQRHDLSEAFHRYCKWNGIDVDDEGFLATEEAAIRADLEHHEFSFESSGYLSFSVQELHQRFGAKFVLLVRRPDKMVNSYLRKGWYSEPFVRSDANKPLGYQSCQHFHHFLGRIAPLGDEFTAWNAMTRVGKLAWYWRALNERVLQLFETLPADSRWDRLEDLDHARYCELSHFLGFTPTIDRAAYDAIVARKPNARRDVPTAAAWTDREAAEFEVQVAPLARRLGYMYEIGELRREAVQAVCQAPTTMPTKAAGRKKRLLRWFARGGEAA